jgi:hypothetical protein
VLFCRGITLPCYYFALLLFCPAVIYRGITLPCHYFSLALFFAVVLLCRGIILPCCYFALVLFTVVLLCPAFIFPWHCFFPWYYFAVVLLCHGIILPSQFGRQEGVPERDAEGPTLLCSIGADESFPTLMMCHSNTDDESFQTPMTSHLLLEGEKKTAHLVLSQKDVTQFETYEFHVWGRTWHPAAKWNGSNRKNGTTWEGPMWYPRTK